MDIFLKEMKKILKWIKSHLFFSTLILLAIFFILILVLIVLELEFRSDVYLLLHVFVILGFIVGFIQLLCRIKNDILKVFSVTISVILLFLVTPYILLVLLFSYKEENEVTVNDEKMIEMDYGFLDPDYRYYKYVNAIVRGRNSIVVDKDDVVRDKWNEYR